MAVRDSLLLKVLLLTSASFIVSVAILISGLTGSFELNLFDLMSRLLNPARASDDIVIIEIDQQSINDLSTEGITWPWPRQMYSPLIEQTREAEAVFLDVLFTEPSSYGMDDDFIFSRSIKKTSNVYLPLFLTNSKNRLSTEESLHLDKLAVPGITHSGPAFKSAVIPIAPLRSSAAGGGNVTVSPDDDGVYRSIPLFYRVGDKSVPLFVLSYLWQKGRGAVKNSDAYIDNSLLPVTEDGLLLRYYRGKRPFTAISASDVLRSHLMEKRTAQKPQFSRAFFKGKKVFIGLTAAGLYDLKPTPVSSISTGVHIHATVLDNLHNKSYIEKIEWRYIVLLIFFLCLIVNIYVMRFASVKQNLPFLLVSIGVLFGASSILFVKGFYLIVISPGLALVTSFIIASTYSYSAATRKSRFTRRVFSQYMDERIVEHVLKNPELIHPGGKRKQVTVFFADIAGFTTISEKLAPEVTSKVLNTIFNECSDIIIKNNGVIDKYIGDCIMAFWGAPVFDEEDESDACMAALQSIEAITEINNSFRKDGLPQVAIRVGIHTGYAIVGNLGSDRLFDYTVVGDTVNLASRLESANKFFSTSILASESTIEKTSGSFFTRELGLLSVKGKEEAVRIYELISERNTPPRERFEVTDTFHEGLALFNGQRFEEAIEKFSSILSHHKDRPSQFYKEWCESLMANPDMLKSNNWAVIKLESK